MKSLLLASLGLLGAALFAAPAQAQFHFCLSRAHSNHARHHDDLEHRSYHRELDHREAHRRPMTHRQHGRLHDHLDHEAFHDRLEHRSAHRSGAYWPRTHYRRNPWYGGSRYGRGYSSYYRPYGSGFYFSRPGFSLHIGR